MTLFLSHTDVFLLASYWAERDNFKLLRKYIQIHSVRADHWRPYCSGRYIPLKCKGECSRWPSQLFLISNTSPDNDCYFCDLTILFLSLYLRSPIMTVSWMALLLTIPGIYSIIPIFTARRLVGVSRVYPATSATSARDAPPAFQAGILHLTVLQ